MYPKTLLVEHAYIGKSALPDFAAKRKLMAGTKGKVAFDKLHRILKSRVAGNGHKNVNVVGHDNKVMDCEFSCSHVFA